MGFCEGELVVCTAGREKDRLMYVTAYDGKYVYLADGKERSLDNPKRKNPQHLRKTDKHISAEAAKTDRALRKALSGEVLTYGKTGHD
ncbi:MAG: KOW domain-containing RNA-binding protein [Oscillospiraceae bacterium]|nr:KOW domain-containing RNA-binding protein [Oscillospiraceae bacterium]